MDFDFLKKKEDKKETPSEEGVLKMVKIKFVKSPTGAFKLAHNVGDVVEFDIKQAAILVEAGFAEHVK